jgi:hypothetical protein
MERNMNRQIEFCSTLAAVLALVLVAGTSSVAAAQLCKSQAYDEADAV